MLLSVKIMVFTVHLLLVYSIQLCMGIRSAGHYTILMFLAESSEEIDWKHTSPLMWVYPHEFDFIFSSLWYSWNAESL